MSDDRKKEKNQLHQWDTLDLETLYDSLDKADGDARVACGDIHVNISYTEVRLHALEALSDVLSSREAGQDPSDSIERYKISVEYQRKKDAVARGERELVPAQEQYDEVSRPFLEIGMNKDMLKILADVYLESKKLRSDSENQAIFADILQKKQPPLCTEIELEKILKGLRQTSDVQMRIGNWKDKKEELDNVKGILDRDRKDVVDVEQNIQHYTTADLLYIQQKHQIELDHWQHYLAVQRDLIAQLDYWTGKLEADNVMLVSGKTKLRWYQIDDKIQELEAQRKRAKEDIKDAVHPSITKEAKEKLAKINAELKRLNQHKKDLIAFIQRKDCKKVIDHLNVISETMSESSSFDTEAKQVQEKLSAFDVAYQNSIETPGDDVRVANTSKPNLTQVTPSNSETFLTVVKHQLDGMSYPDDHQQQLNHKLDMALQTGNYTAAIERLTEIRDNENGIYWHIDDTSETLSNYGHGILIRDARNVRDNPQAGYVPYAIMALNFARAANVLLENASIDPRQLNIHPQAVVHALRDAPNEQVRKDIYASYNVQLAQHCAYLMGQSEKQVADQLRLAKDFMNFEDTHRHIVTVDSVPGQSGKIVMQAEAVLTGLTGEQKDEFASKRERQWYTSLPAWQQKLVDRYEQTILAGTHVIPTQLRTCVVGARNTGMQITAVADEDGVHVTDNTFHSGTVAHLGKKCSNEESERISAMNARQMAMYAGHPVHIQSLNAEFNLVFGNDRDIVLRTAKATEANQYGHSNVCFNMFRFFTPNRYSGINQKLTQFVEAIKQSSQYQRSPESFDSVLLYIEQGKGDYDQIRLQIEKLDVDHKAKTLLLTALDTRHLIKVNFSPLDPENRNLSITAKVHMIDNFLRGLPDFKETFTPCQSGKDRGGLSMHETAIESVMTSEDIHTDRQVLTQHLAKSSHVGFRAGVQGGTLGCFGIKKDSKGAVPKRYGKASDFLLQDSASHNKKVFGVDKPKAWPQIWNYFKLRKWQKQRQAWDTMQQKQTFVNVATPGEHIQLNSDEAVSNTRTSLVRSLNIKEAGQAQDQSAVIDSIKKKIKRYRRGELTYSVDEMKNDIAQLKEMLADATFNQQDVSLPELLALVQKECAYEDVRNNYQNMTSEQLQEMRNDLKDKIIELENLDEREHDQIRMLELKAQALDDLIQIHQTDTGRKPPKP